MNTLTDSLQVDAPDPSTTMAKAGVNVPLLIRAMGILAVIAGFCAYLMEGWDLWSGASRFYVMEAVAVVLAVAGFLTSYWLRENKGARSFFALALISALAFTTTLGGFIYSILGFAATDTDASYIFIQDWSVESLLSLGFMSISAIVVALPLSWFAFKVFNRPHVRRLTITFLAATSLILLPVRESLAIAVLIVVAAAIPVYSLWSVVRSNSQFKTLEGKFSAAVLFAPAIIMLGRLFWLYQADEIVYLILFSGLFAVCRTVSAHAKATSFRKRFMDISSIVIAFVISCISISLTAGILADELVLPVAGLLFWSLLIFGDQQKTSHESGIAAFANISLAVLMMINCGIMDSPLSSMLGIMAAVLLLIRACRSRVSYQFLLAALTFGVAVLPYVMELMRVVDFTNWITLSILGVIAIVAASVLERYKRHQAS